MVELVQTETIPSVRLVDDNAYLVDDLIQKVCEANGIPPVFRYLTGLYDLDKKAYLGAHETLRRGGKERTLQLRIRFHPVRSGLLEEANTLNLYYSQMLYYVLNEFTVKEYSHQLVSQLIGLVAMDYVKQLIEENEVPTDEKTAEVLESITLPTTWKFPWWKKKVVKKDFILGVKQCFADCEGKLSEIKTAFIDGVCEVLLGSRQERFEGQIVRDGLTYDAHVIVGHLAYDTPQADEGPFLKIFQDKVPGDTFPMSQMKYILPLNEKTVEVHLRGEQPITIVLNERNMIEFCTLLDGYYRMTERFYACLSTELQPPSIAAMKKRKLHGPIKGSIAYELLSEACRKDRGWYLVRLDQLSYRVYHIDKLSADGVKRVTCQVLELEGGGFRQLSYISDDVFPSLEAFISARCLDGEEMSRLAPSNYDKTGLQLCRELPAENAIDDGEPDPKPITLGKFKEELPSLRRSDTLQRVAKGTYEGSAAVLRFLKSDEPSIIRRFLRTAGDVPFWRNQHIVPIIGLGIAPQVFLASTYMPLGPLDSYLRAHDQGVALIDLGNAALCLAKAVWYLEENDFVHSRIRCRSAFVVERSYGPLEVKLGEPGLPIYSDVDVPWIAPEHFSDLDSVASSKKADIYALGTTLWEILLKGKSPFDVISTADTMDFFAAGNCLPLSGIPEEFCSVIVGCWDRNLDERCAPDVIVRHIDHVVHNLDSPGNREPDARMTDKAATPASTEATKSKAAQLPALRQVAREPSSQLQRRNSAASQSSIASRKTWKTNNLLKFFLRRETEYETLSSISSIAPSHNTMDTYIPDENGFNDDDSDGIAEDEDVDESGIGEWELRRSDIKLGEPIGQGFFGIVFKAVLTRPSGAKETVAVKKMKSTVADFCDKDLEREISIMRRLRHPNIVEIIGRNDESDLLLVMEYVGMGALSAYLANNKRNLTTKELMKFSHDVACAMAYLERKKIIHRDLAARNILVKSESCVKLSDFGLAHLLDKDYYRIQTMSRNLPIKWYAPESIMYNTFTVKSDVWSYGVALWEIFTFGSEPVMASDDPATLGQALLNGYRLPSPDDCPPEMRQIMRQCWEAERDLRPSFAGILRRITSILATMEC